MLRNISLQNYLNFGEPQVAQLEAITVVVGPNNVGKTNFMRVVDAIRKPEPNLAVNWHRPAAEGPFAIGWECDLPAEKSGGSARIGRYSILLERRDRRIYSQETATVDGAPLFSCTGLLGQQGQARFLQHSFTWPTGITLQSLRPSRQVGDDRRLDDVDELFEPIVGAKHVHLRLDALRNDNTVEASPSVADGGHLAAVVTRWILEFPETYENYNQILARCLPELKRVLVRTAANGNVRLVFEQRDGERFDSLQVSDGVLMFAGIVARVLEMNPGGLVLLEEPERGIHPRRLAELLDLLRTLVHERKMQFILATHSPVMLDLFRDDQEAVLVFRRGKQGTVIRRLSDISSLRETLDRATPGDLLVDGVFNESLE